MFSDAMSAGVNPGGLRSRTEIRVLICFLLVHTPEPVPLERVKERLHFDGIANFFETAYAIADLEESGNIEVVSEENGLKFYSPTAECKAIVEALGNSVPFSVREKALEIAKEIVSRRRNERNNRVTEEKTENGIYVTCAVMEQDHELVSVRLLVPDDSTAMDVKERFYQNPMQVLINATEGLTGTKI